jgi:hypothetical protein
MHHNNKTNKLARFSFLLSHIIPTKQKKSMKQDLSLFLALQQQNRKINEVFFHPIIVTKKRKRNSFLFHSKIKKNFFVPLHVAITKKISTSLFYLAKENNHEKHEKKNCNMAFGIDNKNHIIIGMRRTKRWDQQNKFFVNKFFVISFVVVTCFYCSYHIYHR